VTPNKKVDEKNEIENKDLPPNVDGALLLIFLKSIEAILENQTTIIKKLNLLIPKEENVNGNEKE